MANTYSVFVACVAALVASLINFDGQQLYWLCTQLVLFPLEILINHAESLGSSRPSRARSRNRTASRGRPSPRFSRGRARHRIRGQWQTIAMTALAMNTTIQPAKAVHFDSDSLPIGIDNRASGCISFDKEDFADNLRNCDRVIKGYHGTKRRPLQVGTLQWSWEDDRGKRHDFDIPNSYYDPSGSVRLLSPQHFAQAIGQTKTAGEQTNGVHCKLYWNDGRNTKTVQLSPSNNVATFTTAPSYNKFERFCQNAELIPENDCDPVTDITDDTLYVNDDENNVVAHSTVVDNSAFRCKPCTFDDANDGKPITSATRVRTKLESTTAEMLQLHYDMGHIPFTRIREMAHQGLIPSKFQKCEFPKCAACLFGRAKRRRRTQKKRVRNRATRPGEMISVDQLESSTPGLVAQMTGFLTKKRYKVATIFVDNATGFGFIWLQLGTSSAETLQGKAAFEREANNAGIRIAAY